MSKAPDMRVFNTAVADDHAVYDACLVRAYGRYSAWTRPDFTQVPVGQEHFVEHTRGLVAATLKKELSLPPTFGAGKKSFLPTDLAYRMVREFGGRYHAQREPADVSIEEISAALRISARSNALVLQADDHPLAADYRARNVAVADETAGGDVQQTWMKELELQRDELDVVKKLSALRRGELASLLGAIQPFLLEIDDAHIRSPFADLRRELRSIVESRGLNATVRRELFDMIRSHWETTFDADAFEAANADIVADSGDANILESTVDVILEKGFLEPLGREEEASDARKAGLLRRKVVLEAIFMNIVDTKQWEHAPLLAKAHDAYIDRLGVTLGELGHLALVNLVMTDKVESAEKLSAALR